MAAEGKLYIEVDWNGTEVTGSYIRSCRPLQASRLMVGKLVQDAVDTVPLLFSLCGRAQGVAAVMAIEAAIGAKVPDPVRLVRRRLVLGEMLQEHLWGILFDWFGEPRVRSLVEMRGMIDRAVKPILVAGGWKEIGGGQVADTDDAWSALFQALNDFLDPNVFGCNPAQWLELDTQAALEGWYKEANVPVAGFMGSQSLSSRFGASDVAAMAWPDEEWLRQAARSMHGDPKFSQRPNWNGAAMETGALARQLQHPLLQALTAAEGNSVFARMVARLIELARLATDKESALWGGSLCLGKGVGIAWVETARGLLMHRVATDGARILSYQIVAPTEWNFHPHGALIQGLPGTPATSEEAARSRTDLLAKSLDPCVAYEITVHRTEHEIAPHVTRPDSWRHDGKLIE